MSATPHDDVPDGFERIDHHDPPGYFHEEDGVVITIHERHRHTAAERHHTFPFRVIMAKEQSTAHDSAWTSRADAEEKAAELAASYADDA